LHVVAKSWKASFLSHGDGKYNIDLYALDDVNTLNISELLVRRKYAAYSNQHEGKSLEYSFPATDNP